MNVLLWSCRSCTLIGSCYFVTCIFFIEKCIKRVERLKLSSLFQDECHFILRVRNGGQVVKMEINHVSLSFHSR